MLMLPALGSKFLRNKSQMYLAINMSSSYVIVLVTAADKMEAERISRTLLEEHLIACANIVNPVASLFYWKGKIDCADECLVVMKSRHDLFAALEQRVKALHSYEVPEILALPIVAGSADYLAWLNENLK